MLMLRILLIDDSGNDRALATRVLRQTFEHLNITEIKSPEEFEPALRAGNFDVVVTDYQLRWGNGLEVLRRIKQRYEQRPVVMFTNSGSQEVAVEGMKAGLDDYVLKSPKHYVRLPIAVRLAWERALERQKSAQLEIRLQSLLNRLEVGMFRATLDGEIVEANAAFLRLLGVNQPHEAQSFLKQQLSRNTAESLELVESLQTEGYLPAQETEIYRSDGTLVWIRWNWALITINGTPFIDGLIEDVSDRKQLERMLRANTKELEEANRLKDEFLATLSHELRTPLNAILGWAKLLQTGQIKNQEMLKKALESMERNATLQLRLVEDTLDISNIIRGQLKLDIQHTHLAQVIDQVLDVIQPAVRAKSLQLRVHRSPYLETVPADPSRLQQIIWNLLSNAVKFTPDQGQIELDVQPVGNYAEISVKDTGIGISAEFLPYVFDRFRQQDSSTTRRYGGLGLGLAIVRYLAEIHGGHVQVESPSKDQGTTFTVRLPLQSQPGQRVTAAPTRELGSKTPSSQAAETLAGTTILVVEDEPDMSDWLTYTLRLQGAKVTVADSATAALQVINQSVPDLLISDIGMPGEDGLSLIQKIRQLPDERQRQVPAIALTAYAGDEYQQEALAVGFQQHLAKPVEPEELINVIDHLLRQ